MLKPFYNMAEEVEDSISPLSDVLTREMLSHGFYLRLKGRGTSMYPFVQTGDTLLIQPKNLNELCIGDIVFYRRSESQFVAHRLIKKIDSTILITKGDNMATIDEPVRIEQVLGRVTSVERDGRYRSLDTGLNRFLGRCLARFSPISRWIRPILRPGWKLYRKYNGSIQFEKRVR